MSNRSHTHHEKHLQIHDDSMQVSWNFSRPTPKPNEEVSISVGIADRNGKPLEDFEISHEKIMHVIVVSKDLTYFNHVHPEYKDKGNFQITTRFPTGGEYKLVADFVPKGAKTVTTDTWLTVSGETGPSKTLLPDEALTEVLHGKEVKLSFDHLIATKPLIMTFTFKDAITNNPITNLQPYLGAVGHVVVFSADAEQYIHNHPVEEDAKGPEAKFLTSFPNAGIYKIWGEFKHEDTFFLVSYVINVPL